MNCCRYGKKCLLHSGNPGLARDEDHHKGVGIVNSMGEWSFR
jgi:hypothetical protein